MNHCSGGPTADQFDLLDPLVNCVERQCAQRRDGRRLRHWHQWQCRTDHHRGAYGLVRWPHLAAVPVVRRALL